MLDDVEVLDVIPDSEDGEATEPLPEAAPENPDAANDDVGETP